jgi:hypothetical protein
MRKEAPLLFIKMGGLVSLRVKNNIMQNERPDSNGTALRDNAYVFGAFNERLDFTYFVNRRINMHLMS